MSVLRGIGRLAAVLNLLLLVIGAGAVIWSAPVRSWVSGHGVLLYVIALVFTAVVIVLADMWWRLRDEAKALRAQVQSLQDLPKPRDRELFEKFLELLPPDSGAIRYLRVRFHGKNWPEQRLDPLYEFLVGWKHGHFFLDQVVNAELENLYQAADDFRIAEADETDSVDSARGVTYMQLIESSDREGGQEEWERARRRLLERAKDIVKAHDRLHRVGLERGL